MSDPAFTQFNPKDIAWQWEATKCIRDYDYSNGVLEVFYSGGVGSAKTLDHVHEIVLNCLEQPNSKWLMVRRALKDLKRTSWNKLLKHMRDIPHLVQSYNKSELKITFINGSEIYGDSYDSGDETKFQSLDLSGLDVEEINEMPQNIYEALKLRLGRAGVPINRIQARCNPDSPSHWLYSYFILDTAHPDKRVFYSLTEQNPFLPRWYFENMKRDLSAKMARRKLYGEWLELSDEVVYYEYNREVHYKKQDYVVNLGLPISIMFDFNIGLGKPMSCAIGQFNHLTDQFHIFDEVVIQGARTESMLDELAMRGLLDHRTKICIYGDATGESHSTKSIHSDYDLIRKFLSNYKRPDGSSLQFEMRVPRSNPPVRERHNKVNAYLKNDLGQIRLSVYQKCKVTDEGLRLTALKKGADYIEDDSKFFQHITTAIGYWIVYESRLRGTTQARTSAR